MIVYTSPEVTLDKSLSFCGWKITCTTTSPSGLLVIGFVPPWTRNEHSPVSASDSAAAAAAVHCHSAPLALQALPHQIWYPSGVANTHRGLSSLL